MPAVILLGPFLWHNHNKSSQSSVTAENYGSNNLRTPGENLTEDDRLNLTDSSCLKTTPLTKKLQHSSRCASNTAVLNDGFTFIKLRLTLPCYWIKTELIKCVRLCAVAVMQEQKPADSPHRGLKWSYLSLWWGYILQGDWGFFSTDKESWSSASINLTSVGPQNFNIKKKTTTLCSQLSLWA